MQTFPPYWKVWGTEYMELTWFSWVINSWLLYLIAISICCASGKWSLVHTACKRSWVARGEAYTWKKQTEQSTCCQWCSMHTKQLMKVNGPGGNFGQIKQNCTMVHTTRGKCWWGQPHASNLSVCIHSIFKHLWHSGFSGKCWVCGVWVEVQVACVLTQPDKDIVPCLPSLLLHLL